MTDVEEKSSAQIFSLRLITGEQILSELVVEDENDDFVVMINPVVVEFMTTNEGKITVASEFNPLSDATDIITPYGSILVEPTEASEFYYEFYVRSLIQLFIKKIRFSLSSKRNKVSSTEFELMLNEANLKIQEYIAELTSKFEVNLETSDGELHNIKPDNATLH